MTETMLDDALRAALEAFAARPRVLVASDYDGCVSPIVARPEDAVPEPRSMAALE
ncbi:HAD family hydrolase, partial [Gordonia sihwensis]